MSLGIITNTARVAATTPDLKPDNNTVLTIASVSQIRRVYLPLILLNSSGMIVLPTRLGLSVLQIAFAYAKIDLGVVSFII